MKINKKFQKGFGLIQAMVGMGITMIMALAITSVITAQNKQIKHLEQKSEILDLKNEISMNLNKANVCGCNLNPSKLTPLGNISAIELSNSPTATISLPLGLRHDCTAATLPFARVDQRLVSGVVISNIQLVELSQSPTVSTEWNARLEIQLSNGATLQHKKISLPIVAVTSATAPYTIQSCSIANGGSGGTPSPPTTTAECEAAYGTGWTFSSGACVPPMVGGCNYYVHTSLGTTSTPPPSSASGWTTKKIAHGSILRMGTLFYGNYHACSNGSWYCITDCGGPTGFIDSINKIFNKKRPSLYSSL